MTTRCETNHRVGIPLTHDTLMFGGAMVTVKRSQRSGGNKDTIDGSIGNYGCVDIILVDAHIMILYTTRYVKPPFL